MPQFISPNLSYLHTHSKMVKIQKDLSVKGQLPACQYGLHGEQVSRGPTSGKGSWICWERSWGVPKWTSLNRSTVVTWETPVNRQTHTNKVKTLPSRPTLWAVTNKIGWAQHNAGKHSFFFFKRSYQNFNLCFAQWESRR